MTTQKLKSVQLNKIRPNPLNPRKSFGGKPFEEMIESVRAKGVISPILVRPVLDDKVDYEIIFGERRFRASKHIAKENGGLSKHRIPALVRELSDSEAFDLMTIENLQRQDLTELEEAVSFKQYGDQYGEESLGDLAEKTGISLSYIRRRVLVLDLPKYVLKSWDQGHLKYGHLELLARLGDRKLVKGYYERIMSQVEDDWRGPVTVQNLRHWISDDSPSLGKAVFETEKAGCGTCPHNSDVQRSLFEMDTTDLQCNNSACFKKNQAGAIAANWEAYATEHELPTTGFRFQEDVSYQDYNIIQTWQPTPDQCRTCEKFLSMLSLDGEVYNHKACFGEESCYKEAMNKAKQKEKGEQEKSTDGSASRRVDWHGEFFREKFYEECLPQRIVVAAEEDLTRDQLTLFALLKSNGQLHSWFADHNKLREKRQIDEWTRLEDKEVFAAITEMDATELRNQLARAVAEVATQSDFYASGRRLVADHIGVDLEKEWHATEEYFQKKTKAEILEFGESSELLKDAKVIHHLEDNLGRAISDIPKLKKGELVSLFLESGVELTGKVPEEVLAA